MIKGRAAKAGRADIDLQKPVWPRSALVWNSKERKRTMTYEYKNRGVCSSSTTVTLSDDGVIEEVKVQGGCNGNLKGIMSLLKGMKAEEAIQKLEGITCGRRPTFCPDQIAHALREALAQ